MKLLLIMGLLSSLFGCVSNVGPFGRVDRNDTIVHFYLSEGGGMNPFAGFKYDIRETKDGKVHFLFNEGYPDEKEFTLDDHAVFDSLQQVVIKHKMYRYKGRYQPKFDITDGMSWSLDVTYASGKEISSGGYMSGPKGYRDAFEDVIQCLQHWKDLPIPLNEVVSFVYEYGTDRYTIKRDGDQAMLIVDNGETGEHHELERELDMLEDLRITFNIYGLKMNRSREELEDGCTPWMYDITYSNGDHYHYESYDRDYKCGYTEALQGFIFNWMKEKENRRPLYYYN